MLEGQSPSIPTRSPTIRAESAELLAKTTVFEINGKPPVMENSFSEAENVRIERKQFVATLGAFLYSFPAHSITLLKLSVGSR
jgi:hypothetical protein